MGSLSLKIKMRYLYVDNAANFNHTAGVHVAQHGWEGNPQHAGSHEELRTVALGGCHQAVHPTATLGWILHIFWYQQS